MNLFRKGDIVARNSYNRDILFEIKRIVKNKNNQKLYILKGITERIEADSTEDDLVKIDRRVVDARIKRYESKINTQIDKCLKTDISCIRSNRIVYTGKILHLDGDTRYAEKSARYYKNLGLNAIVKNISESKQPQIVYSLLEKYKPDIIIVTRT